MNNKKSLLSYILKNYGSVAVAFSGGVDSSFLLACAKEVLKNNLIAVTSSSVIHSENEIDFSVGLAKKLNVKHILADCGQMESADFKANNQLRCYFCKTLIFKKIKKIALSFNIEKVIHGENIDDLKELRPGFEAAKEMNIASPLIEAGIDKKMIRIISKEIGLITWNKPSMSCLATRIPYHTSISSEKLKTVETCEKVLKDLGISVCRVRHNGSNAEIVTDTDGYNSISKKFHKIISKKFYRLGFESLNLKKFDDDLINPKTKN